MPVKARSRRANVPALTDEERARLMSRIVDEFERRGWRDDGHTAWAIVRLVSSDGLLPEVARLEVVVSSRFRAQNDAAPAQIRQALAAALKSG